MLVQVNVAGQLNANYYYIPLVEYSNTNRALEFARKYIEDFYGDEIDGGMWIVPSEEEEYILENFYVRSMGEECLPIVWEEFPALP